MATSYSTHEAKAKFSELIKQVRAGRKVLITYRGERVAEIRPWKDPDNLRARLRRAEEAGVLSKPKSRNRKFPALGKRPGALKRFLDSRD